MKKKIPIKFEKLDRTYHLIKQINDYIVLYKYEANGHEFKECFSMQDLGLVSVPKFKDTIRNGQYANYGKRNMGYINIRRYNIDHKLIAKYNSTKQAYNDVKKHVKKCSIAGIQRALKTNGFYCGSYWKGDLYGKAN